MADILETLMGSTPNESSHDLQCRCFAAADEIKRLRNVLAKLRHQNEATGGLSALTELLGCVLTYEVLHVPGVHGQTAGADGTGTFAEVYLCDPDIAAELAMARVRDMESRRWRLGAVHIVQNGEDYGWAGSPMRFLVPNDQASGARSVPLDAPVGRGKD